MKKMTTLLGLALATTIATPAFAQDFTGPRIEARAGWDRLQVNDPAIGLDGSEDDVMYGVGIGYDIALGDRFIAGIEANVDFSEAEYRRTDGNVTVEAEPGRDIEVSARIGARVTDNVLVYGKAGYTNARLEGVLTVGGTTGTTRTEFASNGDGLRVGAGVEFALPGNAYARTEYRYSNYEGGVVRHQVVGGIGFRF